MDHSSFRSVKGSGNLTVPHLPEASLPHSSVDRNMFVKDKRTSKTPGDARAFANIAVGPRDITRGCTSGSSFAPHAGPDCADNGSTVAALPSGRLCSRTSREGGERQKHSGHHRDRTIDSAPASPVSFHSVRDSDESDATCPEKEDDADSVWTFLSSRSEASPRGSRGSSMGRREVHRGTQTISRTASTAPYDVDLASLTEDGDARRADVNNLRRKESWSGHVCAVEEERRDNWSGNVLRPHARSDAKSVACRSPGAVCPPPRPADSRPWGSEGPSSRSKHGIASGSVTSDISSPPPLEGASSRNAASPTPSSRVAISSPSPGRRSRYRGTAGLAGLIRQAAAVSLARSHPKLPQRSRAFPKGESNRGSPHRNGFPSCSNSLSSLSGPSSLPSSVPEPPEASSPLSASSSGFCSVGTSSRRPQSPASVSSGARTARLHSFSRERHTQVKHERPDDRDASEEQSYHKREGCPSRPLKREAQAALVEDKTLRKRRRPLEPIQVGDESPSLIGASEGRYPIRGRQREGVPPPVSPLLDDEVIVISSSSSSPPSPVDQGDEVDEVFFAGTNFSATDHALGGMSRAPQIPLPLKEDEKVLSLLEADGANVKTTSDEGDNKRRHGVHPSSSTAGVSSFSSPAGRAVLVPPALPLSPTKRQGGTSLAVTGIPHAGADSFHTWDETGNKSPVKRGCSRTEAAQPSGRVKESALQLARDNLVLPHLDSTVADKENTCNSRIPPLSEERLNGSSAFLGEIDELADSIDPFQGGVSDAALEDVTMIVGAKRNDKGSFHESGEFSKAAKRSAARPSRGRRGGGTGQQDTSWRRSQTDRQSEDPESMRRASARVRDKPFYGTVGKIMKVELKDFLNHTRFIWTPGSNCNVITGKNGSGKSSMVRAILFCCGAEAPTCSSGSSGQSERVKLFEFIRNHWTDEGPKMAEVRVTFSNYKDGSGHDDAARHSSNAAGVTPSEMPTAQNSDEGELELRQFLREKRELIEQVRSGDEQSPLARENRPELSWRAYQPDIWGTSITIQRRVWKKRNRRGPGDQGDDRHAGGDCDTDRWVTDRSEFALCGGPGGFIEGPKIVKKEEVHSVLRHFGLDFSNPVAYLTQERSKSFLCEAKPTDLYAFFKEVTGLEEAHQELKSLDEKLAASRVEMQRYEDVLSRLEDTVDVWTEAKKTMDEIRRKGAEAKRLSALLPHLRLHDRRVEHSQCTELLDEIVRKLKVEQAAEEDAAKQLSALGGRRTAEQLAKQQEELQSILDELQQLQDKCRNLQNSARRVERERTEKEDAWRDEETLQKKVEERLRLAQQKEATLRERFAAAQAAAATEGTPADLQRHLTLVEERQQQVRKADEAREKYDAQVAEIQRELDKRVSIADEADVAAARQEDRCRSAREMVRQAEASLVHGQRSRAYASKQRQAYAQKRRQFWEEERERIKKGRQIQPESAAETPPTTSLQKPMHLPDDVLPFAARGWRSHLYSNTFQRVAMNLEIMHAELRQMANQGQLTGRPLGPVGEFLFVSKQACDSAGAPLNAIMQLVEEHLGPQLRSWVVSSKRDQHTLRLFFQRHNVGRIPRIVVVDPDAPPYADRMLRSASGPVFTIYKALCDLPRNQENEREDYSRRPDWRNADSGAAQHGAVVSPTVRILNSRRFLGMERREDRDPSSASGPSEGWLPQQILRFLVDTCRIESTALVPSQKHLVSLLLHRTDQGFGYTSAHRQFFKEGYEWSQGRHMKRSFAGSEAMPGSRVNNSRGGGGPGNAGGTRFVRHISNSQQESTNERTASGNATAKNTADRPRTEEDVEERMKEEMRQLEKAEEDAKREDMEAEQAERQAVQDAERHLEAASEELRRKQQAQEAANRGDLTELMKKKQEMLDEGVKLSQMRATALEALEEAKRELQEVQDIRQRARAAEEAAREAARQQIDGEFAKFEKAIADRKRRVAELKHEAEELRKEAERLSEEAAKVRHDIAVVESRKKNVDKKRKSLQATRQEAESRLQRHKEAREQLEKEAELASSRAAGVAAQIEKLQRQHFPEGETTPENLPDLSAEECASRVEELQTWVSDRQRRLNFDPDTVDRKLQDAKVVYELKKQRFDVVRASFEKCQRRRTLRYEKYNKCVHNAGNEVIKAFERHVIDVIQRKAKISLDHHRGVVEVETRDECNHANTQTKALSGGEKSAVQLALITALARLSLSPIHIFDEVDVFMDESNRVRNFNLLLQFSKAAQPEKQFILLTPHSEISQFIGANYDTKDVLVSEVHKAKPSPHPE